MNMKKVMIFCLAFLLFFCEITPLKVNAVDETTNKTFELKEGDTYRIECIASKQLRTYYKEESVTEFCYGTSTGSNGSFLDSIYEKGNVSYRSMESGDYIDIKLKSGFAIFYTGVDDSIGRGDYEAEEKDDFYKYFKVTKLTHDPLKKFGLEAGSIITMDYQYIGQKGTSITYYLEGNNLSGIQKITDYYWNKKFGWDISESSEELNEIENYWTSIGEGIKRQYIIASGKAIIYMSWDDYLKLSVDTAGVIEENVNRSFLESEKEPEENPDHFGEITENDIYTIYPESLTNQTDDILEAALDYSLYVSDERSTWDDWKSALKSAIGANFLTSLGDIVKYIIDDSLKYEEYVDDVVLELLYNASQNESLLVRASEKVHDKYDSIYENIKETLSLSEKYNTDKFNKKAYAEVLANNLNIKKEDAAKLVNKSYDGWDKKVNQYFMGIDVLIDFTDCLILGLQIEQIKIELIDLLIQELPKDHSLQKGLNRLKIKTKNNIFENGLLFFKDEAFKMVGDLIINEDIPLEKMGITILKNKSFSILVGQLIMKEIADKIDGPTADVVIKANIYKGTVLYLYQQLIGKRVEFVKAFEQGTPIEDIDKKIKEYKDLYTIFITTMEQYLNTVTKTAEGLEKDKLQTFALQIKQLDYHQYLNYCVKKIKKNTFNFAWRAVEGGVAITDFMPSSKSKMLGYDGTTNDNILVIPNEIDGKKVVEIDSEAIKGDFEIVILGDNINTLNDNAILTNDPLEYIDIKNSLENFSLESLPIDDNTFILSSSKVFNNRYKELGKGILTEYSGIPLSIEVVENPDSLLYDPSTEYESNGLKLKVDYDGATRIIEDGWFEKVDVVDGKPQLYINYAGIEKTIPLDLRDVNMSYKVHYLDTDFNEIRESKTIQAKGLEYIDEEIIEIAGYTFDREINKFYLTSNNKDVYFIYEKSVGFSHKNYIVDFINKSKVSIKGADIKDCDFISENKDIAFVDEDGGIVPVSAGFVSIKMIDKNGNSDYANIFVDDSIVDIKFKKSSYSMKLRDKLLLELEVVPFNSMQKDQICYEIEDEGIVEFDEEGYLIATGVGKTVITAKINNLEAICEVEVIPDKNKTEDTDGNMLQNDEDDNKGVSTHDETSISQYIFLLMISIFGIYILLKQRKWKDS